MAHFWKAQDLGFHLVPISRGLGHARNAIFEAGSTKIGTRTLASKFSMHLGDLEYSTVGLLESSNSELSIEPKKSSCQRVYDNQQSILMSISPHFWHFFVELSLILAKFWHQNWTSSARSRPQTDWQLDFLGLIESSEYELSYYSTVECS